MTRKRQSVGAHPLEGRSPFGEWGFPGDRAILGIPYVMGLIPYTTPSGYVLDTPLGLVVYFSAMEWAFAFFAFCSLVACAAAVAAGIGARGARVSNLPDVVALRKEHLEVRQEVGALRAEWKGYLAALDAAMEALEDKADTVKRHRRRIEAVERRAEGRENAAEQPDDLATALARARAQGLPV